MAPFSSFRGDTENLKVRASLSRRVKLVLQVLSDGDSDNNYWGNSSMFRSLGFIHDFHNSAAAPAFLQVGQPDLVISTLRFYLGTSTTSPREKLPTKNRSWKLSEVSSKMFYRQSRPRSLILHNRPSMLEWPNSTSTLSLPQIHPEPPPSVSSQEPYFSSGINLQDHFGLQYPLVIRPVLRRARPPPPGTTCGKDRDSRREFFHCIYCTDEYFCYD